MKKTTRLTVQLDDQGHLVLPPEVAARYGLARGATVRLELDENGLRISRAADRLARVYIEPTNVCNLDCSTCMRNAWDEPAGRMSAAVFDRILQGARACDPLPTLFFGGYGEPLAHPDILAMLAAAKQTGAEVELISNGTLLTESVAGRLVEIGLDRLWVSIDGATPQAYADVRLGDALPQVLANLQKLHELRILSGASLPRLGIAFVAMQRNLADLPGVLRLGERLGADRFSITNVLPHTLELREQMLYAHAMYESDRQPSPWSPQVSLPRMDLTPAVLESLAGVLDGRNNVQLARRSLSQGASTCPFLEKGSLSVRWDGAVSPCPPLLHTHHSYLGENLRTSQAYSVGNIRERGLLELWNDPVYGKLRQRLLDFDFSPCTFCNSCEMAQSNQEDCFGNVAPTCGGCLWAQGFIQCP